MTDWPLTGRDAERLVIDASLTPGGEHDGVAIFGAAGVGKTRLAREAAAAAAARGWQVRHIAATGAARTIPMGVFQQWIDAPATNPLGLVAHVIDAIATTDDGSRVVVVVDDAHLLDDVSAFTLAQLVQRRTASVIATIRAGEPVAADVTALWKDRALVRLDLQPLSRDETTALMTAVLGGPLAANTTKRIWDITQGNALYLKQLVDRETQGQRLAFDGKRWVWVDPAGLPPSLFDIVGAQMGALSPQVRDVIDLVAVAEPLELAYLCGVAQDAAVEEAEQRGLITVSKATTGAPLTAMGHPMFAEVQRRQSGPLRLAHVRGRLAQAMVSIAPPRSGLPDMVRLGVLWLDSDLEPNRDVLTVAAWSAILRLGLVLTEKLAAAAVTAGAGAETALLRAQMLILLNRGADAERLLDAIALESTPDEMRATILVLRAANLLWIQSEPERSWSVIDDALAAEAGMVADALWAFRAVQLATAGRPTEAVALGERIDRSGLPPLPAMMAIWALVIASGDQGRSARAVALAEEAIALAAAAPETTYETVNLACFRVAALAFAGDLAGAREVAHATLHQQGDMPGITRSVATAISGMAALYHGDLAAALDQLGAAVADFGEHGTDDHKSYDDNGMSYQFLILHTEALARTGEVDSARSALALMQRCRPPGWDYLESDNLLATAWVAAADGDPARAAALAHQAAGYAREHEQHAREVLCLQTALQFGDVGPVLSGRLAELAALVEGPRAPLVACWALARECRDGDALAKVSEHLEEMGDRVAAADAAAHASLALTSAGRAGEALAACNRATRIAAAARAVTPAARDISGSVVLSRRELDIAALVADGLTNKQIADALTLSVRTVEGHLYRMCTRLGLSRSELAHLINESRES